MFDSTSSEAVQPDSSDDEEQSDEGGSKVEEDLTFAIVELGNRLFTSPPSQNGFLWVQESRRDRGRCFFRGRSSVVDSRSSQ
jgi:hypothetical protein